MTDKSEQPDVKSEGEGSALKSLDEFKSLSLEAMEKELSSKDYSKQPEPKDQAQVDSETSEDTSETEEASDSDQQSEQVSEDETTDKVDDSSDSETSDNQKDKKSNKKDSKFDYEKAYKELQSEFTRRSQKLKELEEKINAVQSKPEKSPEAEEKSRLAQLRKKDPEAAALLEEMIQEQVEKRVNERVKPVEEQVTLRRRQENANRFSQAVTEFQKSDLAELEPELLAIYNENPDKWQRIVWDSEDAFEQLRKELIYRNLDKVTALKSKKAKESQSASSKKERLKESQVGTKTKVTQPTRDVMSDDEFRKLSLEEMEKRLPKYKN